MFLQSLRKEMRDLGNWNRYQNWEQNPKTFFHVNSVFLEIEAHFQSLS